MILETNTMRLLVVREVLAGKVNDVIVCAQEGKKAGNYYTVWQIKDHNVAKSVFRDFNLKCKENYGGNMACLEYFSQGPYFCFLFPFEQERPLLRFYRKEIYSTEKRRRILLHFVAKCMTTELPTSVLYLILKQEQILLSQDGEIRFQYNLDFEEYTENDLHTTEHLRTQCVKLCAEIINKLLIEEGKAGASLQKLITRKLIRNNYFEMEDLYRDVRLIMNNRKHFNLKEKIKGLPEESKTKIFKGVCLVTLILVGFVVFMWLYRVVFGESLDFRLWQDCFKQIGTESLLK